MKMPKQARKSWGRVCTVVGCINSDKDLANWRKITCDTCTDSKGVSVLRSNCNCKRPFSFHLYPTDLIQKQKWLKAIQRDQDYVPGKYSVVCSIHFVDFKPTTLHPLPTENIGVNTPARKKRTLSRCISNSPSKLSHSATPDEIFMFHPRIATPNTISSCVPNLASECLQDSVIISSSSQHNSCPELPKSNTPLRKNGYDPKKLILSEVSRRVTLEISEVNESNINLDIIETDNVSYRKCFCSKRTEKHTVGTQWEDLTQNDEIQCSKTVEKITVGVQWENPVL